MYGKVHQTRLKSRLLQCFALAVNEHETSEYVQEMSQSQTTDQPPAPRGRDTEH